MDALDERVARNEAMYRTVNREIEYAAQQVGDEADDVLELICECGRSACEATLRMTIAKYDEVHRPRPVRGRAGAREPSLEGVVKRTDGYVVVDKYGAAEKVAEAEERRD